jgi:hypothetical protein
MLCDPTLCDPTLSALSFFHPSREAFPAAGR